MSDNETQPIEQIVGDGADKPESAPEPQAQADTQAPAERDSSWTYAALKDERGKRQALAERVAELEAERQAHTQQNAQSPSDQFWSNPDAVLGHFQQQNMQATMLASEANARVKYGDEFDQMNTTLQAAMDRGDPDMHLLRDACIQSGNPAEVAMHWYRNTQQRQPQPVYPSNLAGARNVGQRGGRPWTGPTPLDDIFDRRGRR